MDNRTEGTLAVLAALLVLFSALLDPRISAGIALALLVGMAVFKLTRKQG